MAIKPKPLEPFLLPPGVHIIAAVGINGQLGYAGQLPWNDTDDLRWFKRATMGYDLIVGPKTAARLPELPGRIIHAGDVDLSCYQLQANAAIYVARWDNGGRIGRECRR